MFGSEVRLRLGQINLAEAQSYQWSADTEIFEHA
jgi:hypothetical protein